jgi:hypothetical protein
MNPETANHQNPAIMLLIHGRRIDIRGTSEKQRQDADVTHRLPLKPPSKNSLPPKPPTPDSRKRLSDMDSESRPAKRSRPDDRLHPQRDNTPRQRERDSSYSIRDTLTPRESRPASASSLPNGRGLLKGTSSAARSTSPVSRSRGNSVNGMRHGATALASNRDTPSRNETSSKTSVPPLLSPLNLSMDGHHDDSRSRGDKKRREDGTETAKPSKSKIAEPPPSGRKHKAPMELPPLLSPTLPPEVEEELERKKHASDAVDRNHRVVKNDRDSQHMIKKSRVQSYEEDDEDDIYEFSDKIHRKRFVVTLKIPKRLRQRFRGVLAPPIKKDVPASRPTERSTEQEASQSSQGKKRLANTVETPSATTPQKRPRTTDTTVSSSKLTAPATPSKRPVDMSRASSSNSHTYTPGESSNMSFALTSRLASVDQYVSRLQKLDGPALKEKSEAMIDVARRLKREADSYMKLYHEAGGSHGSERPKESNLKMGCLLTLESIMAFMLGFYCQDLHRASLSKPGDADAWYSIFKFVESRRNEMKRYTPLFGILLLLRATADDQFLSSHSTHQEPDPKLSVQTILQHQRYRSKALGQLRGASSAIEDPELRPLPLPWATVDEIAFMSIKIMRRWADDEGIDWQPEISLK